MSDLVRPLESAPTERPNVVILVRKEDGRNATAELRERAIDRLPEMKKPSLPLAGGQLQLGEAIVRTAIPSRGAPRIPAQRRGRLSRHRPALLAETADHGHGFAVAFARGANVERKSLSVALFDARSREYKRCKIKKRPVITFSRGLAVQSRGFRIVYRDSPAQLVTAAEHIQCVGALGHCCNREPTERGLRILLGSGAAEQHLRPRQLGVNDAEFGSRLGQMCGLARSSPDDGLGVLRAHRGQEGVPIASGPLRDLIGRHHTSRKNAGQAGLAARLSAC